MSLLERVYFLHSQLSQNRYPNSRTLMEEFEISQPTARRDFAYLRDRLLAPIEFDQQKNGFYYTEDNFNLPFENSPRIIFLLGMLGRLAEETGLRDLPEIKQLEMRLSSMVGQEYAHLSDSIHCEWVEVEYPDPDIFDTIIEAIVKKASVDHILSISSKRKHNQKHRTTETDQLPGPLVPLCLVFAQRRPPYLSCGQDCQRETDRTQPRDSRSRRSRAGQVVWYFQGPPALYCGDIIHRNRCGTGETSDLA